MPPRTLSPATAPRPIPGPPRPARASAYALQTVGTVDSAVVEGRHRSQHAPLSSGTASRGNRWPALAIALKAAPASGPGRHTTGRGALLVVGHQAAAPVGSGRDGVICR